MVVFFVKSNENTYPKGRALMYMYRVVPIPKRGNTNSIQLYTYAINKGLYIHNIQLHYI